MHNNGSPPPIFETDENRTWFRVRLPVREDSNNGITDHDTDHDTDHVSKPITKLLAILNEELSRSEIQAALRLKHRRHFTTVYLQPDLKSGLIEMTLPDKLKSRHQRYRRTPAGEALVRQIKEPGK